MEHGKNGDGTKKNRGQTEIRQATSIVAEVEKRVDFKNSITKENWTNVKGETDEVRL